MNKALWLIVALGLAAGAPARAACDDLVNRSGGTWHVTPSGDTSGLTDGECLQQAFDEAQAAYDADPTGPKPRVVLGAQDGTGAGMPFYLGDTLEVGGPDSELSWFHTTRGTFDWHGDWFGLPPGTLVSRPVKIRTPVIAEGEPGAELVSLGEYPELVPHALWIDVEGVEVRGIRFTHGGIMTIHGGLTVDDCAFLGETDIVIFTDDYSVYPHYGDPDPAVRFSDPRTSRITNNSFTSLCCYFNFPVNVFMYASEVKFQGNVTYSDDSGLWMGGLDELTTAFVRGDGTPFGDIYSSHECRHNLITENSMDAFWGPVVFSGHGSETDDNAIVANDLVSFYTPFRAGAGQFSNFVDFEVTARRNTISGNRLDSVIYGMSIVGNAEGFASDNVITDNEITASVEGIRLRRADRSFVVGNTVQTEGAEIGIRSDSTSSLVQRNELRGTASYGIEVNGDDNILAANRFHDFAYFHPDPVCETAATDLSDPTMSTVDVVEEPPGPGGALQVDGEYGNKIVVPDDEDLRFTSNRFTAAAWVHPRAGSSAWRTIVSKLDNWPTALYFGLFDNYVFFQLGGAYNDNWCAQYLPPSGGCPVLVPDGAWTHLAASYDGNALALYVNGSLAATNEVGDHELLLNTSERVPVIVGANALWPEEVFDGLLDDVALWNVALTPAGVAALAAGARPDDLADVGASPVAWWPCDGLASSGDLQVLEDAAPLPFGGHDGYVNPHWCDPESPHYLPGADVLFDYGTTRNVFVGPGDLIDLGDGNLSPGK